MGGISGESIQTIGTVAVFTGAVVSALAWIDRRMEKKIKDHTTVEGELMDARITALKMELRVMIIEHKDDNQERG